MDFQELHNIADMLLGCKNRMFLTHDEIELAQMYISLSLYADQLYQGHLKRVRMEKLEHSPLV